MILVKFEPLKNFSVFLVVQNSGFLFKGVRLATVARENTPGGAANYRGQEAPPDCKV